MFFRFVFRNIEHSQSRKQAPTRRKRAQKKYAISDDDDDDLD